MIRSSSDHFSSFVFRSIKWCGGENKLAIVNGGNKVFFWSDGGDSNNDQENDGSTGVEEDERGVTWIEVPSDQFKILGLRWKPQQNQEEDERSLCLLARDKLCSISYGSLESEEEEEKLNQSSSFISTTSSIQQTPISTSKLDEEEKENVDSIQLQTPSTQETNQKSVLKNIEEEVNVDAKLETEI